MGKFFPSSDLDFHRMVNGFANAIAKDPKRFGVSQEDADVLTAAVSNFQEALQGCQRAARTINATRAKNTAREDTRRLVSRVAMLIRANEGVDVESKTLLGLHERPTRLKQQTCPQEPPQLRFMKAHHHNGATPLHELRFSSLQGNARKPSGAVRLELFVDLIPPDEPIPKHPGANLHSRPWYLRSFTRSPFKVMPPMTRMPMRVVYWARWADSMGNVGPFSETAVAWIEGGSSRLPGEALLNGLKIAPLLEDANGPDRKERDAVYRIVMLEAQVQSFQPQMVQALPPREEPKQLEAPRASEAA